MPNTTTDIEFHLNWDRSEPYPPTRVPEDLPVSENAWLWFYRVLPIVHLDHGWLRPVPRADHVLSRRLIPLEGWPRQERGYGVFHVSRPAHLPGVVAIASPLRPENYRRRRHKCLNWSQDIKKNCTIYYTRRHRPYSTNTASQV